jgi:hypothetical protein
MRSVLTCSDCRAGFQPASFAGIVPVILIAIVSSHVFRKSVFIRVHPWFQLRYLCFLMFKIVIPIEAN